MSDKFKSMLLILNKIDRGEKITVASLMEDLEVSQRSVHRYIGELNDANFPIHFDKEKDTYRFREGYQLKKINISVEEALTLALAKSLLKNTGPGMENSIDSIEEKLTARKSDLPKHIIFSTPTFTAQTSRYFNDINTAIENTQRIEMTYHPLHEKTESSRKVDPQYLFFHEGLWYMRGYCHYVEDNRTFALDRIRSLVLLDDHFMPKRMSPEDQLASSFGAWIDGEPVEVVVRIGPQLKEAAMRKRWLANQKERFLDDGSVELTFNVNGYGGIKKWIYGWIPFVEVVSPKELREQINKELKTAMKLHDNKLRGKASEA